jgi:CRP/FNR family transcriptional regulator, cyclic AMP receptor protein
MRDSTRETLAQSEILNTLPSAVLDELAAVARRRTFPRGQVIFHQGDPGDTIHIVETGRVKVSVIGENGEQALLNIFGAGQCFGELSLIDGQARSATIETLERTTTVVLQRSDFLSLLRARPEAMEQVLLLVTSKLRQITDELSDLAFLSLEARIAKRLLDLAETQGQTTGDVQRVELPVTQEELAAMVGATRPSVSRALGQMEDRGLIRREGRRSVSFRVRELEHLISS